MAKLLFAVVVASVVIARHRPILPENASQKPMPTSSGLPPRNEYGGQEVKRATPPSRVKIPLVALRPVENAASESGAKPRTNQD